MTNDKVLYSNNDHLLVILNISEPGEENGIPSNQYLILNKVKGILMYPGGFGVMPQVLHQLMKYLEPKDLVGIVLSHQDPDIVGRLSSWMEMTEAKIWLRFLPHYDIKDMHRFVGIADDGDDLVLNDVTLKFLPAHFLHSPGQLNVYDPLSKIMFTSDIGAAEYQGDDFSNIFVDDFSKHQNLIECFHRRYMSLNRALRYWLKTIKPYEIDIIAPQYGYLYKGEAKAGFLRWLETLKCGSDFLNID
ncbi:MAG: MBL fold metallo-hydrolase [Methylococcaceae bacterium]|nr:MBL fold metallo-hydrolase [Methylococcaceae bacterium]